MTADHMETYMLTCRAPDREGDASLEPPLAVSIVLQPCDNATNLLKVLKIFEIFLDKFLLNLFESN